MIILFFTILVISKIGPERAYKTKNDKRTSAGSKEMNERIRTIIKSDIWGTFCLMLISLKL